MKTLRVGFILFLSLSAVILMARGGESFTRSVMLRNMAQYCLVPGMVEIADGAEGMSRAAEKLKDKPSAKTVTKAREAWSKLQLAYKRNEMLSYGPFEDQTFWRAYFYQDVHPGLTEYYIKGGQPINNALLERAGAPVKGISALEYLLFSPVPYQIEKAGLDAKAGTNSFTSWFLQGSNSVRRREYLFRVAANLSSHLQAAARKAQVANFPEEFAAHGQESVNLLVNQLISSAESHLTMPLQVSLRPVFAKRPGLTEARLEGMRMTLDGLQNFYLAAGHKGLDAYVRQINPELNERIKKQFSSARKGLVALDKPIDTMLPSRRPPVERALNEIHTLELLFKVDLVSAMGVTVMFHGYDGD